MRTIEIYSTSTCGFCKALKSFLDEQGIDYTDYDVSTDDVKRSEMQELFGGLAVPVIVFDKGHDTQEIQVGFDKEKVKLSLGLV